jgi:predicted Rossmann fold flavoprotein
MVAVWDVIVAGAGAAGLMAAIQTSERGKSTLLLERNRKPGVKILMSGGTRCNITHATDRRGIVDAFGAQGKFLRPALDALGPDELIDFIEGEGVKTKTEPTGKIFPVSDRAADVLQAFLSRLERSRCRLQLGDPVVDVQKTNELFKVITGSREYAARNVVITVGGQSYPKCGTSGDGYAWARRFGHSIVTPRPALVPLTSDEPWLSEIMGITVPDAVVSVWKSHDGTSREALQCLEQRRGSLLFAHFGVSGPSVLDISRVVTKELDVVPDRCKLQLRCDFLPDRSSDECYEMICHEAEISGKRRLSNWLATLVRRRLADLICDRKAIGRDHRLAELSRVQRVAIADGLKTFALCITGSRGFKKAEVTAGGVNLSEVDSKTLQSKFVRGLYFAGEILDVDGPIGGFNFQAAFSTGFLAGSSIS